MDDTDAQMGKYANVQMCGMILGFWNLLILKFTCADVKVDDLMCRYANMQMCAVLFRFLTFC